MALGLIIYQQVSPGPVKSGMRLPLILAGTGLLEMLPHLKGNHDSARPGASGTGGWV